MTAIAHRDHAGFIRQALLYIGVFAASTVVLVLYQFTQDRLGLFWRVWLTRRLVGQYLADRAYLRNKESATVANPDERIADDVRAYTGTTLSFTVMFVNGALAVVSFSGVLWTISRLLFCVAIGYACFGTLVTIYLGRPSDLAELPPIGSRGQLPFEPDTRAHRSRIDCRLAPGGQSDGAAHAGAR